MRVFITGGGCSGFSYKFQLDETVEEGDTVIVKDAASIVVDSISAQYLAGAEVDYVEELMNSSFVIRNPNASSQCGCGSSFSV